MFHLGVMYQLAIELITAALKLTQLIDGSHYGCYYLFLCLTIQNDHHDKCVFLMISDMVVSIHHISIITISLSLNTPNYTYCTNR